MASISIEVKLTKAEADLLADNLSRITGPFYHDREGLRRKIREALRRAGVVVP